MNMIKALLVTALLLFPAHVIWAEDDQPYYGVTPVDAAGEHAEYGNGRFGFTIQFPAKLLIPKGEAANSDGQQFISRDGKTNLSVWGNWDMDMDLYDTPRGESLKYEYEQNLKLSPDDKHKPKIAFKTFHEDWYVVSGTYEGTIFYTKRYLSEGRFVVLLITYPADQRNVWDKEIAYMIKHFQIHSICDLYNNC
jgi:hypothetical protein